MTSTSSASRTFGIVADGGQRADERRADELAVLLLRARPGTAESARDRDALEIPVGDLAQPIVRRAERLEHLIGRARIVEAGQQHQAPEANEAVLVLVDRLQQRRHRLRGRACGESRAPAFDRAA